jgi:hypothetical protein
MVKITEKDSVITIEIPTNSSLPLDQIYTRDYFSLLDLEILEGNNNVGGYKYLGGNIVSSVLKVGENISDSGVSVVNKKVSSIIDIAEDTLTKKIPGVLTNGDDNNTDIRFIIKKKASTKIENLTEYLASFSNVADKITCFKSGLEYLDAENIIKDVFIQLSYLDFLNIKIPMLKMENIYKINDRFLIIEETDLSEKENDEDFSSIREIQKMVVKLSGEEYEKGVILEKMKMVDGTRLYKLLKRLNEGEMGVW